MLQYGKTFVMATLILFSIVGYARQREKPAGTAGTAVSSDGVPIKWESRGRGEPALVFIHGWCCDRGYWSEQLPYFASRYQVVAVDLAGHGESGLNRKGWTVEAFGDDVAAVAAKLNLKRVVLIGHSMGGPVILEAARKMPDRVIGLVAVDSFFNLESKYSHEEMTALAAPFHADFGKATRDYVRTMFTPKSDPKLVEQIVSDMSACPPEVGMGAAFGANGIVAFINTKLVATLRELKAPIVFINSDAKPTEVEINTRTLPSFNAKIVPGVGHFVMMEAPAMFNRLLEESIREFTGKAAK
jgi:pimeloyl-ACP methyl ester carboxylesterase